MATGWALKMGAPGFPPLSGRPDATGRGGRLTEPSSAFRRNSRRPTAPTSACSLRCKAYWMQGPMWSSVCWRRCPCSAPTWTAWPSATTTSSGGMWPCIPSPRASTYSRRPSRNSVMLKSVHVFFGYVFLRRLVRSPRSLRHRLRRLRVPRSFEPMLQFFIRQLQRRLRAWPTCRPSRPPPRPPVAATIALLLSPRAPRP